jgi:cytochrome b-561
MALGLGVRAAPFTYAAHALAVAAAAMVLVWAIQFRGGLAIEATNKNLIFNVSTTCLSASPPLPVLCSSIG